jgi:hypothetical protein
MRKLMLIGTAALVIGAPAGAAAPSRLIVAMHDPGCHWFYKAGGPDHRIYSTTAVRHGAVTLVNLDETTLKIKGPGGTKFDRMGGRMTLKAKGLYTITMVGQAPDDNHLKLTIK